MLFHYIIQNVFNSSAVQYKLIEEVSFQSIHLSLTMSGSWKRGAIAIAPSCHDPFSHKLSKTQAGCMAKSQDPHRLQISHFNHFAQEK